MNDINLFCLPFAGGSIYSYRAFEEKAPAGMNIIPVEYPGRGQRILEPLLTNLDEVVDDTFQQIQSRLMKPYAIYGHSMGSIVGNELVHKIIAAGLPEPICVTFTGSCGPSMNNREAPKHQMDKAEFLKSVKELGGMPKEILENPSVLEFYIPILMADFEAAETHPFKAHDPYEIPLSVFIGDDEGITMEEAEAWKKETNALTEIQQLSGKHFFIFEHTSLILNKIEQKLKELV